MKKENGKYALEVLGGDLKRKCPFQLPFEESERNHFINREKAQDTKEISTQTGRTHQINYPIEK